LAEITQLLFQSGPDARKAERARSSTK